MTSRVQIPSVIFLALTDAVTGMIGVLLVVLVLARPPQEEIHRLQQADSRIACESLYTPEATGEQTTMIRLMDTGERLSLVYFLASRQARGDISVRLAVAYDRTDSDDLSCLERLHSEVKRLNGAYERNRADIHLPYVFLSPYQLEPGENARP